MSSIRSASSMTSRLQPLSMILPRPNRSISRPGVAISTSTPFSSALTWSPICTPPISSAIESLWYLPYFSKFSATCAASSRVGSRISERGMRARLRPCAEDVDHRQHEAGGLAGAGLGDADEVAAHQHRRDRLRLDRRRLVVAAVGDRAAAIRRKGRDRQSSCKSSGGWAPPCSPAAHVRAPLVRSGSRIVKRRVAQRGVGVERAELVDLRTRRRRASGSRRARRRSAPSAVGADVEAAIIIERRAAASRAGRGSGCCRAGTESTLFCAAQGRADDPVPAGCSAGRGPRASAIGGSAGAGAGPRRAARGMRMMICCWRTGRPAGAAARRVAALIVVAPPPRTSSSKAAAPARIIALRLHDGARHSRLALEHAINCCLGQAVWLSLTAPWLIPASATLLDKLAGPARAEGLQPRDRDDAGALADRLARPLSRRGRGDAVARRPREEAAEIVRLCAAERRPARAAGRQHVDGRRRHARTRRARRCSLSLRRMNRIRALDPRGRQSRSARRA